ncbi:hypothetical protein DEO72_LG5g1884 [Vigna unguiculata]|uniref:Uncharacterized protein n=1 Tax=Vigna unguiculata TaxID=3917 RepID=A0A4D6LZP2_VIGUN|nr:hypothetical protein DEO72_LG5g1884 [Vigna unguiculata]
MLHNLCNQSLRPPPATSEHYNHAKANANANPLFVAPPVIVASLFRLSPCHRHCHHPPPSLAPRSFGHRRGVTPSGAAPPFRARLSCAPPSQFFRQLPHCGSS